MPLFKLQIIPINRFVSNTVEIQQFIIRRIGNVFEIFHIRLYPMTFNLICFTTSIQ